MKEIGVGKLVFTEIVIGKWGSIVNILYINVVL